MPALALVAALLTASATAAPAAARPAAPPVVLVTGGDRFGAGVVWDAPGGLVLTALHVVEGVPDLRVSVGGAPGVPAHVVDLDPALDLALLATSPLGAAGSERALATPAEGAHVRMLGFPLRRAAALPGVVVAGARRFAGARYVEIAGGAEPGSSGGPVVDASGAVVGIVDLVLPGARRTLAVPVDAAETRFPRRAHVGAAGPGQPVADAAARHAPGPPARQD